MDGNRLGVLPLWYAAAPAQQGKTTQAITFLEDLQENPDVRDSKYIEIALEQLYATQGNSERVFSIYRKLRSVESDDASALMLYAIALLPRFKRKEVVRCAMELEQCGDSAKQPSGHSAIGT